MVDDETVVAAAVDAAESVVFSRYSRSDIRDLDVSVNYADEELEVDVYLNVPDAADADRVADDAALAARSAVDELLES